MNYSHKNFTPIKSYNNFSSPLDPCPSIEKFYSTPPHLYLGFQQPGLPQFPYKEAALKGTLWPSLYDYYENPYKRADCYDHL